MAVKEIYINPFTDFGFKKLFGTELNKDLLIDFLNEVILPRQKRISNLEYRSGPAPIPRRGQARRPARRRRGAASRQTAATSARKSARWRRA